jgi:hypothetical protein
MRSQIVVPGVGFCLDDAPGDTSDTRFVAHQPRAKQFTGDGQRRAFIK